MVEDNKGLVTNAQYQRASEKYLDENVVELRREIKRATDTVDPEVVNQYISKDLVPR